MKFGGNVYFLYLCSEKWKKDDGVFAKRAGEYLNHSSTSEAAISILGSLHSYTTERVIS